MSRHVENNVVRRCCEYSHNRPVQNLRGGDLCTGHLMLTLFELEESMGMKFVKIAIGSRNNNRNVDRHSCCYNHLAP